MAEVNQWGTLEMSLCSSLECHKALQRPYTRWWKEGAGRQGKMAQCHCTPRFDRNLLVMACKQCLQASNHRWDKKRCSPNRSRWHHKDLLRYGRCSQTVGAHLSGIHCLSHCTSRLYHNHPKKDDRQTR
jgi:hypothetical protein